MQAYKYNTHQVSKMPTALPTVTTYHFFFAIMKRQLRSLKEGTAGEMTPRNAQGRVRPHIIGANNISHVS